MGLTTKEQMPRGRLQQPSSTLMRFSSDPNLVPGICSVAASFASSPDNGGVAKVTLVLRELLRNAVEHGNHRDRSRTVTCRLTRSGEQTVEIAVTDEGDGFDYAAVDYQYPDAPQDSAHCGLRVVHALSDSLRFENRGRTAIACVSWARESTPAPSSTPTETDPQTKE